MIILKDFENLIFSESELFERIKYASNPFYAKENGLSFRRIRCSFFGILDSKMCLFQLEIVELEKKTSKIHQLFIYLEDDNRKKVYNPTRGKGVDYAIGIENLKKRINKTIKILSIKEVLKYPNLTKEYKEVIAHFLACTIRDSSPFFTLLNEIYPYIRTI